MYEEMMMNNDNVESSLLTSSLLKIDLHSLYKFYVEFCYNFQSMKCVVQVKCVGDLPLFILLESITVYMEVQWVAYEHSQ